MSITSRPSILFWLSALIFCCSTSSWSQTREHEPDACADSKRGLHATLNAEPGSQGLETLSFSLMNDSDQVLDSATHSWTLVIDDREVPDPGGQLWTGPGPIGGYGTVRSGTTFQFGKAFPIREYFPEARDYKIYWKSAAFRSNVAVVRGGATP